MNENNSMKNHIRFHCRTCLGKTALRPIFENTNNELLLSKILMNITGTKIEPSDPFSQVICSNCINFVNESLKFRRKCLQTFNILTKSNRDIQHVQEKIRNIATPERNLSKKKLYIYSPNFTEDLTDYSETIHEKIDAVVEKNVENVVEFETEIQDILNKNLEIVFENQKSFKKVKLHYLESDHYFKEKCKEEHRDTENIKNGISKAIDKIECKYCKKIFKNELSLANHSKVHTELNIICEHCGKTFMNKRRLLMHCKARHGYEKTDKCTYCEYRGSNAELVKIHERVHTGERPYVCEECGANFHRRSSYLQHVPIHLPEKTVQCPECPSLFKSVTLMRIHRSRHRSRPSSTSRLARARLV